MKLIVNKLSLVSLGVGMMIFSSVVNAGVAGTLNYGPAGATAIPLMGSGMMVVLALLLAVVGYRALKLNPSHNVFSITVLALLSIGFAYSSINMISSADAASSHTTIQLSNPAGGSVLFSTSLTEFRNTSGVLQRINNINAEQLECTSFPGGGPYVEGPECFVGMIIQNQESCAIDCGGGG